MRGILTGGEATWLSVTETMHATETMHLLAREPLKFWCLGVAPFDESQWTLGRQIITRTTPRPDLVQQCACGVRH